MFFIHNCTKKKVQVCSEIEEGYTECGRKYGSDYECVDGLSCLEKYTYIYIKDRIELDIIYPLFKCPEDPYLYTIVCEAV